MARLLIVANRLPVTLRVDRDDVSVVPSNGGLATALRALHEREGALWIGWTGGAAPIPERARSGPSAPHLAARLEAMRVVPVHLDAAEVSLYYEGFSSGVLWPLLHHFVDAARLEDEALFEAYASVNERFAAVAAERRRPGDLVWVHDYHLMLAPEMIRRRAPGAAIGFFLHTPFPSAEVFRLLPWRERLLRGLLGADVIGFQTASYRRHFLDAIARLVGAEPDPDGEGATWEGRRVRVGVYPIGVDAGALAELAGRDATRHRARQIRERAEGRRIVLGVDRLDYTKGLQLRLAAIERLLERAPQPGACFVQIAVPSREGVVAYERTRREVHEMVGRINGRHGSIGAVPLHFLYQSVPVEELAALYAAADVMLVTPLRDGMNLVAKEYVASRVDDDGALVLSELTGAAVELSEALIVNPYDTGAVAAAIARALEMPAHEQQARMSALRRRVAERDVHGWARAFLGDLAPAAAAR